MKISDKIIKKIRNYTNRIRHLNDKCLVLSFGENCLTDDILSRNNLKSFSTPYSSGRSNIEYILSYEKEEFIDFLNPKYLKYEHTSSDHKKVARNTKYIKTVNYYEETCCNGFEFTHHDVIGSKEKYSTMVRRCKRLLNIRNQKVIILYHHRYCDSSDINMLIDNLLELKELYEDRNNKVEVLLFYQNIVKDKCDRKVEVDNIKGINCYVFNTLDVWEGENQDIFWARCDDDLIKTMIDDIIKIKNNE